jgi:hypothetical protein
MAVRLTRHALYIANVRYWHKADIPSCTAHVCKQTLVSGAKPLCLLPYLYCDI